MTQATEKRLHPNIQVVLDELGESQESFEREAKSCFLSGDYDHLKMMRAWYLESYYLRCLSYLASAVTVSRSSNLSNLPTILSEAAEACSNHKKHECLKRLSQSFFSGDIPQ
jgi:hypothetical protein